MNALLSVCTAALALVHSATISCVEDVLGERLSTALDAFHTSYGFPGATAAIAFPDGSVVTAATGLADAEASRPMTPETRMLAASIGKTFVGATVLKLESEGALSQADLLGKYLGDRAWFADLPNAESITLAHLLRHQSGLPDHPHLPEFQAAASLRIGQDGPAFTPEELLTFVTGVDAL